MMACCCANPSCLINGCSIANDLRRQYNPAPGWFPGTVKDLPHPAITVEQIRQIIREEFKMLKEQEGDNK